MSEGKKVRKDVVEEAAAWVAKKTAETMAKNSTAKSV